VGGVTQDEWPIREEKPPSQGRPMKKVTYDTAREKLAEIWD